MLIRRTVPQSDRVFSSEDFKAGELVTLAQSCIWFVGWSELAKVLNTGKDPHSDFAALILGTTYEEFIKRKKERRFKDTRQAAKPPDFGFPGGMSELRLVLQQREQGPDTPCPNGPVMVLGDDGKMTPGYKGLRFCILMGVTERCGGPGRKTSTWKDQDISPTCLDCLECGTRLRALWRKKWPEMHHPRGYFAFVNGCMDGGMVITTAMLDRWPHLREVYAPDHQLPSGTIMQPVSGRLRGGLDYCAACNGFFQGLLADVAKEAHRIATRECDDKTIRVPDMLFPNSKRSEFANCESPLVGSFFPVFAHDELLGDHPRSIGHEAATRTSEILRDVLRWRCPDLADAAEAEPTLMNAWSKQAECVRDANGRLVPWVPKTLVAA